VRNPTQLLCFALLVTVAACGGEEEGDPTGSTCPPGSTLTYETFGNDFMQSYCIECHASDLPAPERMGAPVGVDFDTLEGILDRADEIDRRAAAGPDATNTVMPPAEQPQPSEAERLQLGEWLACETSS
jgi:uncharacterized membrane protein